MAAHPDPCPTCDRIRTVRAAGTVGRNEIAKALGIAAATVTNHAKHAGVTFDRTMTAVAVEARKVDLADLRTRAAERALLRVHTLYDRLEAETTTYRLVFKEDSELVTDTIPPIDIERGYAQSINTHVRTAAQASPVETDRDLPAVDAWLAHMTGEADG